MKKILLPTNFSKKARNAASFALKFFQEDQARFHLLNACRLPYRPTEIRVAAMQGVLDVAAKRSLIEDQHRYSKKVNTYGTTFTTATEYGGASKVIVNYAQRHRIDFVVMGTKGGNFYKKLFSGSHTREVLQKAHCPVIAIPEEVRFKAPRNILFIPDPQTLPDQESLKPLLEISKKFNSEICSLILFDQSSVDKTEHYPKQLKSLLGDAFQSFHLMVESRLSKGLENFLEEQNPDLIVLQGRARFLKTVLRSWDPGGQNTFRECPLMAIRN